MKNTIQSVKKQIKEKFKTTARFSRNANLDEYALQKFFALARHTMTEDRQKQLDNIAKLVKETDANIKNEKDISQELRDDISNAIESYGGVGEFCQAYPQFSEQSVRQVINGIRKFRTQKVDELIEFLKIKA